MIYDWHIVKTILPSQLEQNKPLSISVGDKEVCILKQGDEVYSFAATCPHASAKLCDGWVDAQGRITCPLHKYKFDPKNGRNTSGEGYKLKIYPTKIREGNLYIGLW